MMRGAVAVACVACGSGVSAKTLTVYHILPRWYSGLANRDAGDALGDAGFVIKNVGKAAPEEPDDVAEGWSVSVGGGWGTYKQCNIDTGTGPVGTRKWVCCDAAGSAGEPPCEPSKYCTAGRQKKQNGGYWYSFPACGENSSWTPLRLTGRVAVSCLVGAWLEKALLSNETCNTCPQATTDNPCLRDCIAGLSDADKVAVWGAVVGPGSPCAAVPLPDPAPPAPPAAARYACGSAGACVQTVSVGHKDRDQCESTCHKPTADIRYTCGGMGSCYQTAAGKGGSTLGACAASCTRTPAPAPPTFACGSAGACVQTVSIGHQDRSKCESTCHEPTASTRYTCGGMGSCYQTAASKGATLDACVALCAPPTYACGSAGACVRTVSIGHLDRSKCESTCDRPTADTRYTCGGLGACYQAAKGGSTLRACTASCASTPAPHPGPARTPAPPSPATPAPAPAGPLRAVNDIRAAAGERSLVECARGVQTTTQAIATFDAAHGDYAYEHAHGLDDLCGPDYDGHSRVCESNGYNGGDDGATWENAVAAMEQTTYCHDAMRGDHACAAFGSCHNCTTSATGQTRNFYVLSLC